MNIYFVVIFVILSITSFFGLFCIYVLFEIVKKLFGVKQITVAFLKEIFDKNKSLKLESMFDNPRDTINYDVSTLLPLAKEGWTFPRVVNKYSDLKKQFIRKLLDKQANLNLTNDQFIKYWQSIITCSQKKNDIFFSQSKLIKKISQENIDNNETRYMAVASLLPVIEVSMRKLLGKPDSTTPIKTVVTNACNSLMNQEIDTQDISLYICLTGFEQVWEKRNQILHGQVGYDAITAEYLFKITFLLLAIDDCSNSIY